MSLFRYPCIHRSSNSQTFGGHGNVITNLRFLPNSQKLISIGGNDRGIFQWEVDIDAQVSQLLKIE